MPEFSQIIDDTLRVKVLIKNAVKPLTSLKYFCEGIPELHVCAAGSLLGLQLAEGSFPVGKVDLMSLYPMTFLEFLHGIGDLSLYDYLLSVQDGSSNWSEVMHPRVFARFKDYLIIGGLPEVVAEFAKNLDQVSTAYEVARKKQESLIFQYVADIKSHFKPRPSHIHSALHKGGAHAVPTLRDITFSHQKGIFSAEKYAY